MAAENLYIVKRTFMDPETPNKPSFNVTLPATFTELKSAKEEAKGLLKKEGYDTEFFKTYVVNDGSEEWKYGDGVLVYAKGPSDEVFSVGIETVSNTLQLKTDSSGRVTQPLHHILQTVIDYDTDRSGSKRFTCIEGTYATRQEARLQARKVLLDENTTKEDFVEYDEYTDSGESPSGVVVHAVKEGGQNMLVSVISA